MPLRSSSSPADIGLSKSEYEEAVNLEKLYFLVNKNDRCAICGRGGVAGVDVSRYEFLCASCSSGKSSFKRIGEDRFSSFEVNKLYARFDRGYAGTQRLCKLRPSAGGTCPRQHLRSSGYQLEFFGDSQRHYWDSSRRDRRGQSRSPPPRASTSRAARGSRRASRRQPSPVYAESESDDDEEPSPPPPRRSHSMPRGADSSGRYKQQRYYQHHGGDPFDNLDGGGWGDSLMSQGGPRAAGPPGGGGGMSMMSNCSPAAAGMLGLGVQHQTGLAGMLGGGGGLGAGAGMMGGGLLQQQQPWGGGGAAGAAGLQQQQLLQQQLLQQQQQLLLLRQQQMAAAAAAGRGVTAGMLGATNPGAGLSLGQGGAAGGMLGLGMQRPQTFPTAGNAGMLPQQQQLQTPFFAVQQQPQYPLSSTGAASSNPFLTVQPQQQPGLAGSAAGTGSFASLQQPAAAAFPQQQLLQQQTGVRQLGAPAATMMGGQQSSNPFTSLGAVQRSSTPTLANAGRFGGGGTGTAPCGGNVYNSSLW